MDDKARRAFQRTGLSLFCGEVLRKGLENIDKDQPFVFTITLTPDLELKDKMEEMPRAGQELAQKQWKPKDQG